MIRCAAYCRVSTNSKDQENSFENQKIYFEREIKKNTRCKFAGIYADKGKSGTKLNRPAFDKMLYDAGLDIIEVKNNDGDERITAKKYVTIPSSRSPMFDVILVKNTARFARNVLVEDILRDLRKKGVYVNFLDLNKSTKNQEDIIFLQMFQIFDESESRKKSNAVMFGHAEGAKRGIINAGHRIYGYNYIKEKNCLEIIPHEAKIIKKIFDMYSNNKGIRQIINTLSDEGIMTRGGKRFCKSSIKNILTNEKYYGVSVRKKYDTGVVFNKNSYAKIRDKEEQIVMSLPEKIPPIISKKLFDECQNVLKSRVNHRNAVGIYKGTTEFAGLLRCGKCGNTYTSNMNRGKRFYKCSTKKSYGLKACDCKNISYQALNDLIIKSGFYALAKQFSAADAIATLKVIKKEYTQRHDSIPHDKISNIQNRLSAIASNEGMLIDLRLKEILSEEALDTKSKALKEEREELELALKGYTMSKNEIAEAIEEIEVSMARLTNLKLKETYSKEEILADIDKIIILPNNQLRIKLKSYIDESKVKTDGETITLTYGDGSIEEGLPYCNGKIKISMNKIPCEA